MNKILIVGGTGFLGESCLKKLSSLNSSVSIVGRKEKIEFSEGENFKYYQLDINNPREVESFLKQGGYSHLLYVAWPPSPPHNSTDHIEFAAASIAFLKIFSCYNPGARLVFTGSIYETGVNFGSVPNNFQNMHPKTIYGLSKKFVWDSWSILQTDDSNITSLCWVRLSNIYGLGDHTHKALPSMIDCALNKKNYTLNNPNAVVDFLHITDAATGIIHALLSDYNGVINIGSGCGYLLSDVRKFIELHCENDGIKISKIQSFLNSEFGSVLDISTASSMLGYSPSIAIENGVTECIEFLRNKVTAYANN
jgi:nucleoside-diphosphate-sugar epimerase